MPPFTRAYWRPASDLGSLGGLACRMATRRSPPNRLVTFLAAKCDLLNRVRIGVRSEE
jgi:hypothetical protein